VRSAADFHCGSKTPKRRRTLLDAGLYFRETGRGANCVYHIVDERPDPTRDVAAADIDGVDHFKIDGIELFEQGDKNAGVSDSAVTCVRDTYNFLFPSEPAKLVDASRLYYGPTMNAFAAAEQNSRAANLHKALNALFESQNKSEKTGETRIPATVLRVTVTKRT
jgi:hypothetical protein